MWVHNIVKFNEINNDILHSLNLFIHWYLLCRCHESYKHCKFFVCFQSQSENVKKYDILAVIPTNTATLSHACTTMDVDIISFSPEARSVLKINRKLYKQAVERGVFFEIMYAPALKDSTCRKNIIQRAHLYHAIGKSANIIISSGAETEYQIRGPYDIINLYPF